MRLCEVYRFGSLRCRGIRRRRQRVRSITRRSSLCGSLLTIYTYIDNILHIIVYVYSVYDKVYLYVILLLNLRTVKYYYVIIQHGFAETYLRYYIVCYNNRPISRPLKIDACKIAIIILLWYTIGIIIVRM